MKVSFWKNRTELIFMMCLIALGIIFTLIGVIKFTALYQFFICGIILLIPCLMFLLFCRSPLTKLILSEEGLECKWFKQISVTIRWNEIIDVGRKQRSMALSYLSLVTNDKQVDIDLTKKMYDTIMILCPYENIKSKINSIQYFKYLHE